MTTAPEVKTAFGDALNESTLANQVQALFNDNKIEGLPYGKQAAGFNDLRALAEKVQWLVDGESIPVDGNDPSKGNYPFTKTAATFNDVRALATKVDALNAVVAALVAALAAK